MPAQRLVGSLLHVLEHRQWGVCGGFYPLELEQLVLVEPPARRHARAPVEDHGLALVVMVLLHLLGSEVTHRLGLGRGRSVLIKPVDVPFHVV